MDKLGVYWGYTVRVAEKFEDIFEDTKYPEPYDLKIGISQDHGELSDTVDFEPYQDFKHAVIFFGGLEGIEGIIEQDERSKLKAEAVRGLFDTYINCLPNRGTRSIRTEENILISLSNLMPKFRVIGKGQ